MARSDSIEVNGVVTEVLPGTNFKVQLENGHIIDAYLSGKMRVHYVRVFEGDKVRVALSPYDLTKGRIIFRDKN